MIDLRRFLLDTLPKNLFLDLEDRQRAAALHALKVVRDELPLNAKRSREAEGQIRFRLQEQAFEEVVVEHGGHLLTDGIMVGTDLKVFQPFARFAADGRGVIIGFAAMPEPRKLPPKNKSRAAGVTLNLKLQPSLLPDDSAPKSDDIFMLFLTARDRERAGHIEEIAVGVISGDYKDFLFYQSLEEFLSGYAEPADIEPEAPNPPPAVKLRTAPKRFVPPESKPDTDEEAGTAK